MYLSLGCISRVVPLFWDAPRDLALKEAIDIADHHHLVLEMFGAVLTELAFARTELATDQRTDLQNCELQDDVCNLRAAGN